MICSNTLKLCINFNSPEKYSSIFTPNLSEFDCYLTLNEVAERHTKPLCKENLIHSEESSQIEFIHKKDPKGLDHLWIDFDPAAKYVASIREKFHDQVLVFHNPFGVFHNPFGGTHIGIIFKRSLFKDTPNIQILKKPKLSFDSKQGKKKPKLSFDSKQGKKVKQSLPYPVNAIGFDDDSQKWLTEPNYHGIIMDIDRCGSGILQSINKK
ncbi:hypothetical protein O9G_005316 [Rozella allomycis CSF55]|uniref:U3 small nucleolar RNA-associated protein 22 n=1 Tax=Rozella allomycis (strain CSF55) TaxID=988480 RepID=A0A075B383_ROZAC|nr:hypothetical protein O9G_005316 [Rozella allomycis CSF55]|eukprot:EPZ37010.1 hypothetical protein O9G_005316 [Rozella allomycis CSF55]